MRCSAAAPRLLSLTPRGSDPFIFFKYLIFLRMLATRPPVVQKLANSCCAPKLVHVSFADSTVCNGSGPASGYTGGIAFPEPQMLSSCSTARLFRSLRLSQTCSKAPAHSLVAASHQLHLSPRHAAALTARPPQRRRFAGWPGSSHPHEQTFGGRGGEEFPRAAQAATMEVRHALCMRLACMHACHCSSGGGTACARQLCGRVHGINPWRHITPCLIPLLD